MSSLISPIILFFGQSRKRFIAKTIFYCLREVVITFNYIKWQVHLGFHFRPTSFSMANAVGMHWNPLPYAWISSSSEMSRGVSLAASVIFWTKSEIRTFCNDRKHVISEYASTCPHHIELLDRFRSYMSSYLFCWNQHILIEVAWIPEHVYCKTHSYR